MIRKPETLLNGTEKITIAPPRAGRKSEPLVSAIMSNFNGSSYLEAAVASVLGQSHQSLELIVVDDASGDNSLAILQH